MNHHIGGLGKPHVELAGLKLWVHGYQYPNADDNDDANWLNAIAICSEKGAVVQVNGAFIRTIEIFAWQRAVEEMAANRASEAKLECLEPELAVTLKAVSLGAIEMRVQITPDQLTDSRSQSIKAIWGLWYRNASVC